MAKLLIVEDTLEIASQLKEWLEKDGYLVEHAASGTEAQDYLAVSGYDAIILDWQLPGISGIALLAELRAKGDKTPVLMMTGKDEIADIERSFNSGVDDYMVKPVDFREVRVRLIALQRRREVVSYEGRLKTRTVEVDSQSHKVWKNGKEVNLQPQEFALLHFLLSHPGDMFDADALIARVWSSDSSITKEGIRVCVTRVRNKLDVEGEPSIIRTVRKSGYQICLES